MVQLVFYGIFLILLFSIMGKIIYDYRGAKQLRIPMTDKRWPGELGWVKMAKNVNGVEIHYVYNKNTQQFDDFKFK